MNYMFPSIELSKNLVNLDRWQHMAYSCILGILFLLYVIGDSTSVDKESDSE